MTNDNIQSSSELPTKSWLFNTIIQDLSGKIYKDTSNNKKYTNDECNLLQENLYKCKKIGMFECQYLIDLLENKCNDKKSDKLFTMNNK